MTDLTRESLAAALRIVVREHAVQLDSRPSVLTERPEWVAGWIADALTLPEAAVQEPPERHIRAPDGGCSCGRSDEEHGAAALEDCLAILAELEKLPSPAPEPPPGYWEASGDLTAGTAKAIRPILEQAVREGKQLVVHEGITLRWRAAQPAPDPEAIRLLSRLVETHAVYLDALNGVGHPDEPHNSDFGELGISLRTADECSACAGSQYGSESDMHSAFDEARSFLQARELGGES